MPRIHLVNPSARSFGVAVITPRWLYVLAAATGRRVGDPRIVDETLDARDVNTVEPGDVVGIGIHTGNARRGYKIGHEVRRRGAWVVFAGIHATLFPDEAVEHGTPHAVGRGDGDLVWSRVVEDCLAGQPQLIRARIAFVLISRLYRQMSANTGIATDQRPRETIGTVSALDRPRVPPAVSWKPMPDLTMPGEQLAEAPLN